MTAATCDYYGCQEPVCEADMVYTPPTRRFCATHSEQFNQAIEAEDVKGLMQLWIQAHGWDGIGFPPPLATRAVLRELFDKACAPSSDTLFVRGEQMIQPTSNWDTIVHHYSLDIEAEHSFMRYCKHRGYSKDSCLADLAFVLAEWMRQWRPYSKEEANESS